MKTDKKLDTVMYIIGWCVIGLLLGIFTAHRLFFTLFEKYQIPCLFHTLTGYYCPGCGGTRAVKALFSLHFVDSFRYHPLVPYTAAVGGWFMVSQTIERVTGGKIRIGMHYRDCYLWIAAVLLVLHFLVVNLLLAVWHIDILA